MNLLKVTDIEEAQHTVLECLRHMKVIEEEINITDGLGKIISEDLRAKEDIPSFRRSTVDGYAVKASDVSVVTETVPIILNNVGSVEMGKAVDFDLSTGECIYVPTGGEIPLGADAVVMIEYTETFGDNKIAFLKSVAKGSNMISIGEDAKRGDIVAKKGTTITSRVTGVLSAAGFSNIKVFRPLKISLITTGDELIPPDEIMSPGKIRNINAYSISSMADECGYEVLKIQHLPDNKDKILSAVIDLKGCSDIVCISGGSSKGKKDYTAQIIDEAGDPGAIILGLSVKPGKPTIIGYDKESKTIITGLPGHPVSSYIIFKLLFGNLMNEYAGAKPPRYFYAKFSQNLSGSPGKTTYFPVKLKEAENEITAEPIFGKSGLISTLSEADGLVVIEKNKEGLKKGDRVKVYDI